MKIYFDEAGRGPLFWPLYIGLVISSLSAQELKRYELFQDSKKLTPKQRKVALEQIETLEKQGKLQTALGTIDAESIDRYGITRAINLAICKGLYQLLCSLLKKKRKESFTLKSLRNLIQNYEKITHDPIQLILDGKSDFWLWKELGIQTKTIIHGDAELKEISIASLLAKVKRDELLEQFAAKYPEYGFEKHKGYGTKAHYAAIEQHGILKEHRKLFLKKSFPDRKLEKRDTHSSILIENEESSF